MVGQRHITAVFALVPSILGASAPVGLDPFENASSHEQASPPQADNWPPPHLTILTEQTGLPPFAPRQGAPSLVTGGRLVLQGRTRTEVPSADDQAPQKRRYKARGQKLTRQEAARLQVEAVPSELRDDYAKLRPLRRLARESGLDAHERFWMKIVAERDPHFTSDEERRAGFHMREELRWWSKVDLTGSKYPKKAVSVPFYLTETMRQLAERHEPSSRQMPGRSKGTFKFRSWAAQRKAGVDAPQPPAGASAEELERLTEHHLTAAMERSLKQVPPDLFTAEDAGLARLCVGDHIRKVDWQRRVAQFKGRQALPPWTGERKKRCYERETVSELANRLMAERLHRKRPQDIEKARDVGRQKYGSQAPLGGGGFLHKPHRSENADLASSPSSE